jgi:hypothetical protein
MKKTMLAAALAALAIGSASAETIYITGSTAFRGAANNSIDAYVTNNGGSRVSCDNATLGSAGNVVWSLGSNKIVASWTGSEAGMQSVAGPASTTYGTNTNPAITNTAIGIWANQFSSNDVITNNGAVYSNPVITKSTTSTGTNKEVFASYKSVNSTVLQAPNVLSFWDPSQSFTNTVQASATTVKAKADIAFTDTYQASSAFGSGSKVTYYATNNYWDASQSNGVSTNPTILYTNSYVALSNDTIVGAVGFAFIVSPNYASATASASSLANGSAPVIDNITTALAKKLYTNGILNAAELSGGLDTNVNAYATGRSIDSGTRVIAQATLGLSSLIRSNGVNTGVNQFTLVAPAAKLTYSDGQTYVSNSGSTLLVTNWPAELYYGKLSGKGAGGFASGGTLCDTIAKATNLPSNTVVIGYAGINDATGKNAKMISYNGVYPSVSAIRSGNYPFWSYEHVVVAPAASATAVTFASNVATQIKGLSDSALLGYAKGTVSYATITNTVSRAANVDGGTVTKLWTNATTPSGLPNW